MRLPSKLQTFKSNDFLVAISNLYLHTLQLHCNISDIKFAGIFLFFFVVSRRRGNLNSICKDVFVHISVLLLTCTCLCFYSGLFRYTSSSTHNKVLRVVSFDQSSVFLQQYAILFQLESFYKTTQKPTHFNFWWRSLGP